MADDVIKYPVTFILSDGREIVFKDKKETLEMLNAIQDHFETHYGISFNAVDSTVTQSQANN